MPNVTIKQLEKVFSPQINYVLETSISDDDGPENYSTLLKLHEFIKEKGIPLLGLTNEQFADLFTDWELSN